MVKTFERIKKERDLLRKIADRCWQDLERISKKLSQEEGYCPSVENKSNALKVIEIIEQREIRE